MKLRVPAREWRTEIADGSAPRAVLPGHVRHSWGRIWPIRLSVSQQSGGTGIAIGSANAAYTDGLMLPRLPAYLFATCCLLSRTALAWAPEEHVEIGRTAYRAACDSLRADVRLLSDKAVAQTRLAIACLSVAPPQPGLQPEYAYEAVFGEWSALAADFVDTPEQLLSVKVGDIALDYRRLARIAMTNYKHFHPAVVTSWRDEQKQSVARATSAATTSGIIQLDQFESALAIQAFAQHYLQDAFSAGHMGFNRVASSNATALAYHNSASKKGRCIRNLAGETWYTYGDGRLKWGDSRAHVIAAAKESVREMLLAFIDGSVADAQWQQTWLKLPAFIDEAAQSAGECAGATDFVALRSISKPAGAATTFELMSTSDITLDRRGEAVQGVLVGASAEFAVIPFGFRTIRARMFAALGMSVREIGPHGFLAEYGYLVQLGTTNRGLLTHEIGYAQNLFIGSNWSDRRSSIRLLYAANLETGRLYLRAQAGLAYRFGHAGLNFGAGVGWLSESGK